MFKAGDKVICIDDEVTGTGWVKRAYPINPLVIGALYTIQQVRSSGKHCYISEIPAKTSEGTPSWFTGRFRLATPEEILAQTPSSQVEDYEEYF